MASNGQDHREMNLKKLQISYRKALLTSFKRSDSMSSRLCLNLLFSISRRSADEKQAHHNEGTPAMQVPFTPHHEPSLSLPCTTDSLMLMILHGCPGAAFNLPLTLSLHGPQLQLCCCIGQVLFQLEYLILLHFALLLQLIHLTGNHCHEGVSSPISRASQLYRTISRDKQEPKQRTYVEQRKIPPRSHLPTLNLLSYLVSQKQVLLIAGR